MFSLIPVLDYLKQVLTPYEFNLYDSGQIQQITFLNIFLVFPRKQALTFHKEAICMKCKPID